MSQLPTPRGSGEYLSGQSRRSEERLPRTGITESLNAPGLDVPTYFSQTAAAFNQWAQVSGLVADVARQRGQIMYRNEQERLRAEQDAAEQSAREERFQRGAAARAVDEGLPAWQKQLDEGKIVAPDTDDPEAFRAWLRDWTDQQLTGQEPEAFADQFRKSAGAWLANAVGTQQAQKRDQARRMAMQDLTDWGVAIQTDPRMTQAEKIAELSATVDAAQQTLKVDRTTAMTIALAAMESAAQFGDQNGYDAAKAVLGDTFGSKQADYALRLKAVQTQQVDAKQREAKESLQARMNDPRVTAEQVMQDAKRKLDLGMIDQDDYARVRSAMSSREKAEREQAMRELALAQQQEVRGKVIDAYVTGSMSANQTMGTVNIPEQGFDWSDPATGAKVKMSRDEIAREVTARAMQQIDAKYPDNPEMAMQEQVQWFALNYGTKNDQWERVMAAGVGAADASLLLVDPEDGKSPAPLPTQTLAGYELAKRLKQQNQTVYERHLPDAARLYYNSAELLERYVFPGEPEKALRQAARIDRAGLNINGPIKEEFLRTHADWINDATFGGEKARAEVVRLANLYRRLPGLSEEAAIEEASKDVQKRYQKIGNSMVFVGSRGIGEVMDIVAPTIIGEYVAKFGAKQPGSTLEPVEADSLTLLPLANGEQWVLWDEARMQPVDRADRWTFTTRQLIERAAQIQKVQIGEQQDDAIKKILKARMPRPEEPWIPSMMK